MYPYQVIEHTADVGLLINGNTVQELFLNAVKGLFHIISPSLRVCIEKKEAFPTPKHLDVVELKAPAEEELLVYWLNEFIYYFFVKGMFPKIIEIDNLRGAEIRARIDFEKCAKSIPIEVEIKSTTYHNLSIKKINNNWQAQVIFDV